MMTTGKLYDFSIHSRIPCQQKVAIFQHFTPSKSLGNFLFNMKIKFIKRNTLVIYPKEFKTYVQHNKNLYMVIAVLFTITKK